MRLLDRHWHDGALGNVEVAPLVGKGAILALPDRRDDIERLFPAGPGLSVGNTKSTEFLHSDGTTGSYFYPTVAQDIERGDAFSDAYRMVVGKRQQHYPMTNTDL